MINNRIQNEIVNQKKKKTEVITTLITFHKEINMYK